MAVRRGTARSEADMLMILTKGQPCSEAEVPVALTEHSCSENEVSQVPLRRATLTQRLNWPRLHQRDYLVFTVTMPLTEHSLLPLDVHRVLSMVVPNLFLHHTTPPEGSRFHKGFAHGRQQSLPMWQQVHRGSAYGSTQPLLFPLQQ